MLFYFYIKLQRTIFHLLLVTTETDGSYSQSDSDNIMPLLFKTFMAVILKLLSTKGTEGSPHTSTVTHKLFYKEVCTELVFWTSRPTSVCSTFNAFSRTPQSNCPLVSHQMNYTDRILAPSAILHVFRNLLDYSYLCE